MRFTGTDCTALVITAAAVMVPLDPNRAPVNFSMAAPMGRAYSLRMGRRLQPQRISE
jgi:hypothetical protein